MFHFHGILFQFAVYLSFEFEFTFDPMWKILNKACHIVDAPCSKSEHHRSDEGALSKKKYLGNTCENTEKNFWRWKCLKKIAWFGANKKRNSSVVFSNFEYWTEGTIQRGDLKRKHPISKYWGGEICPWWKGRFFTCCEYTCKIPGTLHAYLYMIRKYTPLPIKTRSPVAIRLERNFYPWSTISIIRLNSTKGDKSKSCGQWTVTRSGRVDPLFGPWLRATNQGDNRYREKKYWKNPK